MNHTKRRKRLVGRFFLLLVDNEHLFRFVMTLPVACERFSLLQCYIRTMGLILNSTTLFYHNISSTKTSKTVYGTNPIANWVTQVS